PSTPRSRGDLASSFRRSSKGSLPPSTASSSMKLSFTKAVCECPTDLHHSTGTPTLAGWYCTLRLGIAYGISSSPSTEVPSIPFLTITLSNRVRSEEHTSELQSRFDLVCRLLLEKKKKK